MKPVNVATETIIGQSVEKVSDYASDPDNAPQWYVKIGSAEWKTPKPLRVGSQIAFKARFLGREMAYTYEIVEYVPGAKLVMQTSEGPFPMETTYLWESAGTEKTRMTLRNAGQPSGFSGILAPIMSLAIKRANRKDLQKLKLLLEAG